MKAGEAIAQHIVAEGAVRADLVPQGWLGQFRLQLLKAGQPEHKAMEDGEENGGRRDVGSESRIGQAGGGSTEIEDLVEVTGEGRKFVVRPVLLFINAR